MASVYEKMRWNLFKLKREIMFSYGIKHNKIFAYGHDFIERLRSVYFGPIPLSMLMLLENYTNGLCYYRAPLIAYGFLDDDFECVDAIVDSIRLDPKVIDEYRKGTYDELYGDHCYVIRRLNDGSEWVYDVSLGLVFEKDYYYLYEKPQVRKVNDKNATIDFISRECRGDENLDNDKYILPFILSSIENNLKPTQDFYLDSLLEEIRLLKEKVKYDELIKEINDMKKRTTC